MAAKSAGPVRVKAAVLELLGDEKPVVMPCRHLCSVVGRALQTKHLPHLFYAQL